MRPTIKIQSKKIKYAIYGHFLSIIGALFALIFGLISLITLNLQAILTVFAGIFILVVEINYWKLQFLKDAAIRGVLWIAIAVIAIKIDISITGLFGAIPVIIAGVLYIMYKLQ